VAELEPVGNQVRYGLRSKLWRALRVAAAPLRGGRGHGLWSWLWEREFDSLIRDQRTRAGEKDGAS